MNLLVGKQFYYRHYLRAIPHAGSNKNFHNKPSIISCLGKQAP